MKVTHSYVIFTLAITSFIFYSLFLFKLYKVENDSNKILHEFLQPQAHKIISGNYFPVTNISALNENALIYNRIPKTGSHTFTFILQELASKNKLKVIKGTTFPRHETQFKQQYFVRRLKSLSVAYEDFSIVLYNHIHWVNFTEFNNINPVYFNSVRDPIDRYESRFNYQRQDGFNNHAFFGSMQKMEPEGVPKNESYERWFNKTFEECVLNYDPECVFSKGSIRDSSFAYFCGQEDECLEYGTDYVMNKVKENIEKFYPVVAVLERLEVSLKVAEIVLPKYFNGAWDKFNAQNPNSK